MRGKKRPPEERASSVAGQLPPCRVCGEPAAGFHYGVNTCEACKGFFRRSLLKDGNYDCLGSGDCVISTDRRRSCPKCRYLKCLSVGMSREAIKTGRYTYTKRTQDTLELKLLQESKKPPCDTSDLQSETLNISAAFPPTISAAFPPKNFTEVHKSHDSNTFPSRLESPGNVSPINPEIMDVKFTTADTPPTCQTDVDLPRSCSVSHVTSSLPSVRNTPISEMHRLLVDSSPENSDKIPPGSQKTSIIDSKQISPMNSEFLSPISMAENSELSQDSQKDFSQTFCSSNIVSKSAQPSPAPGGSCSLSPLSLQSPEQRPEEPTNRTWTEYSEAELEDFIFQVVEGHRVNVEDSNSVSEQVLQELFQQCKERCSLQTEVFGHLGALKRDEHDLIYASTGLDVDGRLDQLSYCASKMDSYIRQLIAFMKLIPGFKALRIADQTALVKASIYDQFLLGYFRGYYKKDHIVVEQSRTYCRHQIEIFDTQENLELVFNISQRLQDLHLTFDMVILLKALSVFFSDRATLEEPDNVEQLQSKVAQSLLLLLRRHFPARAGVVFGQIISVLAQSRKYAEDCHKFIISNMFRGSYMERLHSVPILLELFSASVG